MDDPWTRPAGCPSGPVEGWPVDGRLYAFILRRSPKAVDLLADPRFALHSWPRPFEPDGFDDEVVAFTGRAVLVEDERLHARVGRAVGDDPAKGIVFELDLESALHKHRVGGLTYDVWRAHRGG